MDRPAEEVLLVAMRTNAWQQARAHLITLAATLPAGSVQRSNFEEVIDQLVSHVEENKLHV